MNRSVDDVYLDLILQPIRSCARYRPKFGQGNNGQGLDLAQFQTLYRADPFYSWFGLDNPLMYAAHKAAGGMTSVYRQIGIGCERLFRAILCDNLNLSQEEVHWSYPVHESGRIRRLSLDARIPLNALGPRHPLRRWVRDCARRMNVDADVVSSLRGVVFEVRQGYKSKDSKRQNADIANAGRAYAQGYLPCAAILSAQIDIDIMSRYANEGWAMLVGTQQIPRNPHASVYDFMSEVVGYDLAGFFERNSSGIRREIDDVLRSLLTPENRA